MRRRHSRARAVRRRMRFLIAEGSHEGSQKVVMHAGGIGRAWAVRRCRRVLIVEGSHEGSHEAQAQSSACGQKTYEIFDRGR